MTGASLAFLLLTAGVDPAPGLEAGLPDAPEAPLAFYRERDWEPVWITEAGPGAAAERLLVALDGATGHGLRPEHYRRPAIAALLDELAASPPQRWRPLGARAAAAEVLMTAAFLRLGDDLASGRLDAARRHPSWLGRQAPSAARRLAAMPPDGDPAALLAGLAPEDPSYQRLRGELAALRADPDEAGSETRQAARERLIVNLERHRWLPRIEEARAIRVELADFRLQALEAGEVVLETRVVVGRPDRQTPAFSHRLSYLVLNPTWDVPPRLAKRDLLPRLREEPGLVEARRFTVLERDQQGVERPVEPTAIDWQALDPERMLAGDLRLRQAPHPTNPMGRVKVMFPNPFRVNLHDTPERVLFKAGVRTFSAGCVRVEEPLALAAWLLEPQGVDRQGLEGLLGEGTDNHLWLEAGPPIHLLYRTAWVDEEGALQYREDVYGRDGPLLEALEEDAPAPQPRPQPGEAC